MLDPSLIPLVQRLDRDPEDREAIETLCRELDARAEHEVLAMLLEKVAGRRRSPDGSVELLHRAATMWSTKVGNDPRAIPLWNQVLEVQPAHEGAMLGLAAIFRRTNRAEQAEALYRRLLEKAVSPAKRVPLLEALAALYGERELPEREIETRRELAVQRGAGAAATANRRSLAKLLVERSRRRAATAPLAEGEVDPDKREAAALLGAVAREGATGRATEFAQAALSLWPGDEGAFAVLEESGALKPSELTTLRIEFLAANPRGSRGQQVRRALADSYVATQRPDDAIAVLAAAVDDDPQAAQSLAKLYDRLQRHLDLAKLLDRFPTPTDAEGRLALLRRRAQAWRAAGQRAPQLAALRALLDESPAEAEALAEIERDCRLQGLLAELRDRLRAAATVEGDAASRVRWLREVAQLAERRFDDVADARAAWEALERVADKADDRAEAQDALVRLMARVEDWDHVLERLAAQAEAEEDASEARRRWMRWAQVRREHRPDPAREVAVLETLWAKHPNDDGVARALVDARRRAGDDLGVTEVLYALIENAGPANASSRWSQLAEHLERVGDLESSAEAWQSARTIDPTSALAWEAEARVLGALGDREGQLTALVAYADHPVAAGRRAGELYARAAQLAFELGRKERAAHLAERALRFSPDDDAMKSLVATLEDPGTAPVSFEELLAEAEKADAGEATGVVDLERDEPVEEPTAAVMIPEESVDEPTGAVAIEALAVDEPEATTDAAVPPVEAPADVAVEAEPKREAPTPVVETPVVETTVVEPDVAEAAVVEPAVAAPVDGELAADDGVAELSDDLLEEIVAEPTGSIEAPRPVASPPLVDHEELTPLEGVRLPEATSITMELEAPPLPPPPTPHVAPPEPVAPLVTAELDALPVAPQLPVAPPPPPPAPTPPPVAAAEDSMIFDESLFGDAPAVVAASPPVAPALPPPAIVAAPPPVTLAPSPPAVVAPPRASVVPPPSAPLPRQRIATSIPPSMPFAPPPVEAPALLVPPVEAPVAPPLQFTPPPAIAPAPPPALQFNPQPVIAPAPPPALQFNPQPVIAPAPPPPLALQFNPQPLVDVAPPPPPALQFNPQPVVEYAPQASPGDPFGRAAGDWVVDASGDPFAENATPVAAPPVAEPPALAPQAVSSFERVLLPMFESLTSERRA